MGRQIVNLPRATTCLGLALDVPEHGGGYYDGRQREGRLELRCPAVRGTSSRGLIKATPHCIDFPFYTLRNDQQASAVVTLL